MSSPDLAPRAHLASIASVWVAAVLVGAAVGVLAPAQWRAAWLAVGLGGLVIASFAVQLGVGRSHGFVRRVALSAVGALLVLGVISAGFGLALVAPS